MGVKAREFNEENGTHVVSNGDGNLQSRLGVRTYLKGYHPIDEGKMRIFEPFIEANWIHNTQNFGATLNGLRIDQAGEKNLGELKVGVEAKLNQTMNLWGSIGQQLGDKGYSDTQGILGVKVTF